MSQKLNLEECRARKCSWVNFKSCELILINKNSKHCKEELTDCIPYQLVYHVIYSALLKKESRYKHWHGT